MRLRYWMLGASLSGLGWGFGCSLEDENNPVPGPDGGTDATSPTVDAHVEPAQDAGADTHVNVAPPTLLSVSPDIFDPTGPKVLTVAATGVLPGARVLVDGVAVTSTSAPDAGDAGDAGAGVSVLYVALPASFSNTGYLPVVIENAAGDAGSRSAPLWLYVEPADGGLSVYDFWPDNGNPGDTIRIVGKNLGTNLSLNDGQGVSATANSDGGTADWGAEGHGVSQYATFTLPNGWHSGQVSVSNGGPNFRATVFNVGTNLARNASSTASTEFSEYPVTRAVDDNLSTSWFSRNKDCATDPSCTTIPWVVTTFEAPKTIGRIAIRGHREYPTGYDILRARVEILGPKTTDAGNDGPDGGSGRAVLFTRSVAFPPPNRDLDIIVSPKVSGSAVRLVSEEDESDEPGLAEIEVFEN